MITQMSQVHAFATFCFCQVLTSSLEVPLHPSCTFFRLPEEEGKIFSWKSLRCSGGDQDASEQIQMHHLTAVSVNSVPERSAEVHSNPSLLFALTGGNENSTANE